jgi:uncharacterized membrane protein YdjX (TVP38/TMEM64 family)
VASFLLPTESVNKYKRGIPIVVVLLLFLALAAMWRWTALAQWLDVDTVSVWLDSIRAHPAAAYLVIVVFIVGSQIMFPVTILIFATAYTFGPRLGFAYAILGSLAGAITSYWIGYLLGHDAFRRVAGRRYRHLEEILKRNGLVAVVTTHLIPVGPFTIVNLAAGAVGVPFWQFTLGCAIGLLPGVAIITIFEQQLENAFHEPGAIPAMVAAVLVIVLAAWGYWARRLANTEKLSAGDP